MGRLRAIAIVAWACGGVALLFVQAILRLLPRALEPLAAPAPWELVAYAGCVAFLGYTEGYRAFHVQFIPRVVARALALVDEPRPLRVVLAPFFAMAFFGATKRRLLVSWLVTIGVVLLIVGVQQLPMPWRGMIDGGVVLSLAWGVGRLLQLLVVTAATGRRPAIAPDLPPGG